MKKLTYLLLILSWNSMQTYAQHTITPAQIQNEIERIDLFDGIADNTVQLSNELQTNRATKIYVTIPLKILQYLETNNPGPTYNKRVLKGLMDILSKVGINDYYQLTYYEKLLNLAWIILHENNDELVKQQLIAESKTAIQLSEFIKNRKFAKSFWLSAIYFHPTDALAKFTTFHTEPYAMEVLEAIALDAPTVVKEYFGSNHLIFRTLKESTHPNVRVLLDIYKELGPASKSYILLNEIIHKRLSILKAHEISGNQDKLFKKLLEIKNMEPIWGRYSVEKELEAICMEKIVEINLRHDDSENHRFEPVANSSAEDIYTYMVYTDQEIFTSSFMGLYQRMMAKKTQKSGFSFLQSLHFNRFRIFLKQCAGYNKLDDFIATMNIEEREELFYLLAKDLDLNGGDLGPAVDVADFYGSLNRADLKQLLKAAIERNLIQKAGAENSSGMKIYGLLLKLMGGNPEAYIWQFEFELPPLDRVTQQELFTNGKHIQQHLFFDDEDGQTAYQNFMAGFGPEWKKVDRGSYVLLSNGTQKIMEIYVVKPQKEIEAREELRELFDANKRFPDLVVHRGHSYYIEHTINALTNHTKVAILGSCGGFQNISQAMENAMDVQIVSTKQIGTLAINSILIMETIETIRKDKDIIWPELWKRVRAKVGGNPRFNDYIPPHLNMGARFIKAYNQIAVIGY
jgi:hypothetical protein